VLVLSDGSLWQDLVLKTMGIPFVPLLSRGTVTASALDLALNLTRGEVFITGMDLANRDLRTHARPYSFNRILEFKASRFLPFYSETFVRARAIAHSGSHGIYAAWFGRQMAAYPKRLHTLGKNNPVFDSLQGEGKNSGPGFGERAPKEKFLFGGRITRPSIPAEHALKTLLETLSDPVFGPIITGELSPLLLEEGEAPSPQALKEAIRSLGDLIFPGAS
jgi:hypothetical protein